MTLHEPGRQLADFTARLRFDDIPEAVISRCEELFLDSIAAALAARGSHPVPQFELFARRMGPTSGASEILVNRERSSPLFAAWVNAAASHLVEQDDLHNASVLHPATVVFPPALALAQDLGADGREFIAAVVAGYEAGIRVGEFLGPAHYRTFHTTATAGSIAAAVAAGRLLQLDPQQMLDCIGSAGTQAAGLWEFLRDAADSKQLHTAHAAAAGVTSAYLAQSGVRGAQRILEGRKGMAAGMTRDADAGRITAGLGTRWALTETSFKFHASCRHTHPAADALLALMHREGIAAGQIAGVTAKVHGAAIDVLGDVGRPATVHQAKFSMGTVLGLIAHFGRAGLEEFRDHALTDPRLAVFREKVRMELDPAVDRAYPSRWLGRVEVRTTDGRTLTAAVDHPRGDPENTLSRSELEDKALRLARFGEAATGSEVQRLVDTAWSLRRLPAMGPLLP